ncbi:MAG: hypothetical protein AB8B82_05990 [Roseovarius sp.]
MLSTQVQFIAASVIMAAGIVEAGVFGVWDKADPALSAVPAAPVSSYQLTSVQPNTAITPDPGTLAMICQSSARM